MVNASATARNSIFIWNSKLGSERSGSPTISTAPVSAMTTTQA